MRSSTRHLVTTTITQTLVGSPEAKALLRRKAGFVLASAAAAFTAVAHAQPTAIESEMLSLLEGTAYIAPHRETADGQLTACGLEFNSVARDNSTKHGAPVVATGSFYLRKVNGTVGYSLKLGVRDGLDVRNTKPFAPANAFVRAPRGMAPKKAIKAPSDTLGFALYIGSVDSEIVSTLRAISEEKKMIVGFNRQSGQQDVNIPLDLAIKSSRIDEMGVMRRERDDEMVTEFMACTADLVK